MSCQAIGDVVTKCYNIVMLKCIKCEEVMMEIPVYNNAQDGEFPPSFLFCNNKKCNRFGLLSVVFKQDGDKEGKH